MEHVKENNKIFTIPNVLTILRFLMIPVFVWFYSVKDQVIPAVIVLLISGGTDIVDGFIARTFNMVSDIGRIIDPAADKFTQIAVMVCLCIKYSDTMIPYMLVLLVIKELANGIIGLIMMKKSKRALDSKWHGKLATVCIYFTIMAHLVWPVFGSEVPEIVSFVMPIISMVVMVYSFVMYTIRHIRIIKECDAENEK